MSDYFESATPEQKLKILTNELRTPVEIIRGTAEIIRTKNESLNIEPLGILSEINTITEAADKIKNLIDETVRSKGFYTPSKNLSSTDILLYLRQRLLDAREQSDADTLSNLAVFFDVLWEIVDKREIHGGIGRILENLENSAYDSIREEEIISALNRE
jgi:hypothetical protein